MLRKKKPSTTLKKTPRKTRLPQELRLEVYRSANGRCHYCGCSLHLSGFEVDHKLCRYSGGIDEICNLVLACIECNGAKGVRTYRSFISLLQRKGLAWRDQQYALRQELFKKPSTFKKAIKSTWYNRTPLIRFALEEMELLKQAKMRRKR